MNAQRHFGLISRAALGVVTVCLFLSLSTAFALENEDDTDYLPKVFKDEGIAKLPELPKTENLKQFTVGNGSALQFFLDTKSLQIGKDGVIRFVVVIKNPSGTQQIKLEGIRCETFEYKLYATLGEDGKWKPTNSIEWKMVPNLGYNQYQAALGRGGICAGTSANTNLNEFLANLP